MTIGSTITWNTVNGPRSGVVVEEGPGGYYVLLKNGTYSLVSPESVIPQNQ